MKLLKRNSRLVSGVLCLSDMFFHVGSQEQVDFGLVSASLLFKPFQYIAVPAERDLLFHARFESPAPHDCLGEHFRRNFGRVGIVNVLVLHFIETGEVSL